jgi:hypothetical protein
MFVVAVTVVLFAGAVWTRAQDPLPTQPDSPTISCPDTIRVGDPLYGSASDPDHPLVVTARAMSGLLGTGPDATQDGDVNSFCFPPNSVPPGSWIVITAIDGKGYSSVKFVRATA